MRAVGYVRVSLEEQGDGYSPSAQDHSIREFAEHKGWSIVEVCSDIGTSGRYDDIRRRGDGFKRVLQMVEQRECDVVIVHSMDRWARNLRVLLSTLNDLASADVTFVSLSENLDFATPAGKLTASMLGAMSEYFVGNLATHVRKGLRERSRRGLKNGDIPFGYRRCQSEQPCSTPPGERDCAGGVHVVEGEADALREVFDRYARAGASQTELARYLNGLGHRTRNKRDFGSGATPQPFTTWSVGGLLRNAFYVGLICTKDGETFDGQHAPVLSRELFEAAQARRASPTVRPNRPTQRSYLLRGLVACSRCGTAYWSETLHNGNRYYRGARRGQEAQGEPCGCANRMFPCREIDARVAMLVDAIALPHQWLEQAQASIAEKAGGVIDARRRTAQLAQKRKRISTLYADGMLDDAGYRAEKRELEAALAELREAPADEVSEARTLLESLRSLWQEATLTERRDLLRVLVDTVYIEPTHGKIAAVAPKPATTSVFAELVLNPSTRGATFTFAADVLREGKENAAEPQETGPDGETVWWRRGRLHLPVHRTRVTTIS